MKLIFTNAFGNKGDIEKKEIEIDNCSIKNYNPNEYSPAKAGDLTVEVNDNNFVIQKGKSVFNSNDNTVNFNKTKYSIFNRLAMQDGNDSNLTIEDIEKASRLYKQGCKLWELGVLSIEYNKEEQCALIKIKGGEILHISFKPNKNEPNISDTKNATATSEPETKELSNEVVNNVEQTSSIGRAGKSDALDAFYSNIPKSYDVYIKKAAKEAGVSEEFIKHLITCEGKGSKAVLTAYKCRSGIWTIGFGHTNATGVNSFDKNDKTTITLEQAFKYLVDDIKVHRKDCISWLGKKFTQAPSYIQEGIIDRSFQAGQRGFRDSTLAANLGDEDCYPAFISRCLWIPNDSRRSALRFLLCANRLDTDMQGSARRRFSSLGHEKDVMDTLRGAEKKYFKQGFESLGKV